MYNARRSEQLVSNLDLMFNVPVLASGGSCGLFCSGIDSILVRVKSDLTHARQCGPGSEVVHSGRKSGPHEQGEVFGLEQRCQPGLYSRS